ncbi:MAG TPA: outer membrane beta-barrel protein [Bradyrhizobium sp.]|nr:outer membrane beta-barrel protein [Bradyrhizobium sp.]
MRSVKFLVAAGAASLLSSMVFAADLAIAPPPMSYAPPADFGGWYLRGDIGMTNQRLGSLHSASIDLVDANFAGSLQNHGFGFDSSTSFDLGVGYQFNNWFRVDVTGEWRGKANLHGSQNFFANSTLGAAFGGFGADNYTGSKSEAVFMASAYFDLGTWWCLTPFIGAGIGTSYNRISSFRDDGVFNQGGNLINSVTYAGDAGKWNFAWALHAGVSYHVTPYVAIELAYRYISLGDGVTGRTNSFDGVTVVNASPFTIKNITSNDIKLGVRWSLESAPVYAPPLITKG